MLLKNSANKLNLKHSSSRQMCLWPNLVKNKQKQLLFILLKVVPQNTGSIWRNFPELMKRFL